ncbi:MAG TPA: hypothetical protein VM536_20745 [Chloroflexia bacterium]|nr:hypothetical protein [Chloroflexia bacterium]
MRNEIERLIAEFQDARRAHQAIDRDAEPRSWAQADLDAGEAASELSNAMREAARKLGLVRELSRALAGTGLAVGRLAFDPATHHLQVELNGYPESPAEQRRAADPATTDRVRTVTEDFFGRTGIEVAFPYSSLR